MNQCILVVTLTEPEIDPPVIDRFLFFAEAHGFAPVIVFNKIDLSEPSTGSQLKNLRTVYETCGYTAMALSARTGEGIEQLEAACKNTLSFLAGPSGVGKTSILARLFPCREFRTAPLSAHTRRGVHTTTSTCLLTLKGGGYIADTPGIANVTLPSVAEDCVITYFPELVQHIGECRFNNCAHDNEPGCAVKELVEKGVVARSRYASYLSVLDEIKKLNARPGSPRRNIA